MARKGMQTSIVVIVAAVVILITALIVISVFTGGLGTFNNIFNPWANQTGLTARCQAECSTQCVMYPTETGTPSTYSKECKEKGIPCVCSQNKK
jgi:amino acid transporter